MIKSAGKRLVVIEIEPEEVKKETLIIFTNKEEQMRVRVIAAGCEVDNNIQVGDVLCLPSQTGIPVLINGENYLSIAENQILAAYKE